MNTYLYDEINNIKELMKPSNARIRNHSVQDEYVVMVNSSKLSQMFAAALMLHTKGIDSTFLHIIIEDEVGKSFVKDFLEFSVTDSNGDLLNISKFYTRVKLYNSVNDFCKNHIEFSLKKVRFATFLDASDDVINKDSFVDDLNKILNSTNGYDNIKFVHTSQIPQIKPISNINIVAEKEYEIYSSNFDNDSNEQFVLKIENIIRKHLKTHKSLNAVATRIVGVYGPGFNNEVIAKIKDDIVNNQSITVDTAKSNQKFALTYSRLAGVSPFIMFVNGKRGNIYNIQQTITSEFELGLTAYNEFATKIEDNNEVRAINLITKNSIIKESKFTYLSCEKFKTILKPKFKSAQLPNFLYATINSMLENDGKNVEYNTDNDIARYNGKLEKIKALEIEMMEDIKKICEKHNIKYFLVGGSLLGAIRHQGFIPWDDDLDIGMLREDYEVFRRVAPKELSDKYSYQSFRTEKNSHYIFDKIRLKNTFFSTKYSNMFDIENGIFIDILIYDRTSKNKKLQKMHTNALRRWTRVISIKWANKPRKNVAYKASKIMLPFMRLVPFKYYHMFFELMLKWYRKTKNPYVIDGVGQNIDKGAFPIEWLEDTIDVKFENTSFPIPKDYDKYLRHWYGNNYMKLLPYSTRNSGHLLARIDLGPYAYHEDPEQIEFLQASTKGELYDK